MVLPGNRGADVQAYEKVAIMMNQLDNNTYHDETIYRIMNGLDIPDPAHPEIKTGLDCLINIIDRTQYPLDYMNNEADVIAVMNNIEDIANLTGTLNGLDYSSSDRLVDVMGYAADITKVYGLVNGLAGVPGEKMYQILNGISGAGTSSLVRVIDGVSVANLLEMMNNVSTALYMTDIFNNLALSGTSVTTLYADSSPTAAEGMAELINEISDPAAPGENLTIKDHLVRLIDDISSGTGEGAANIGKIVSGLDNTASPSGVERLITIMNNLYTMDLANKYTDPLCDSGDCTSDHFGRLTTFMNDIFGGGADTTVSMINKVDAPSLVKLTDLIRDVKRIRYITDVINNLTNPGLMITILNDPFLDVVKLRRLCDSMGDKTYPVRTAPLPRYTDAMSTAADDGLGRMTVLMNEVVTEFGAANIVAIMNDIADFNKLTGMIAGINEDGNVITGGEVQRIRYLSGLINNVENIDLMINILNGFTTPLVTPPVDYATLVQVINEIGSSIRKGDGTKTVGDVSILYETINKLGWDYAGNQPRTEEQQSKLITLMNNVNKCGIDEAYDLNDPASHLIAEPCASGQKRIAEFMLGMNDAKPVAIIVGDVTDTGKTVSVMNGMRNIEQLIDFINYVPGEVTAAFMNAVHGDVMYTSTLFLMNRLDAKALACVIHYGTGIGSGIDRSGPVSYFTGVGPLRMASMLTTETGPRLYDLMEKFGWRTSIPSMVCGYGTPNAPEPQVMDNKNPGDPGGASISFYRTESIDITDDPHYGTYTHVYFPTMPQCESYYPEKCTGNVCESKTDPMDFIIWEGGYVYHHFFSLCSGGSSNWMDPGISSVWDTVMEEGTMDFLMNLGGIEIAYPPDPKWWANGSIDPETMAPVRDPLNYP